MRTKHIVRWWRWMQRHLSSFRTISIMLSAAAIVGMFTVPRVSSSVAVAVVSGWIGMVCMLMSGYLLGLQRGRQHGRVIGQWMAWPEGEDGMPISAPIMGRLVVDNPND